MAFNTLEFVFLFLPLSLFLYHTILNSKYKKYITIYIFSISLLYYAMLNAHSMPVILSSIVINYMLGQLLFYAKAKKIIFYLGLSFNILLICAFKYMDFLISSVNGVLATSLPLQNIVLPLGISFFTFQQISYLFDIYQAKHDPSYDGFMNYCCYICFFPQLVAGPIVHHKEMMPQFFAAQNHVVDYSNIYHGLVLLSMGLSKKVVVADNLSPIVQQCFDKITNLSLLEALLGSITYTLQVYFDFSGYCDIAIACALFFNINLPINFNSPYKAASIGEFWGRWHITLSRWLRDYVYFPLGGSRNGEYRTYANLIITFLVSGLWHGAAWTFVFWGLLHGVALVINRWWRRAAICTLPRFIAIVVTFSFVVFSRIFFRSASFTDAGKFFEAFSGCNGIAFSASYKNVLVSNSIFPSFMSLGVFISVLLFLVFFAKNSLEMYRSDSALIRVMCILLYAFSFFLMFLPDNFSEFIYRQF